MLHFQYVFGQSVNVHEPVAQEEVSTAEQELREIQQKYNICLLPYIFSELFDR
ncbi:hypothetical protein BB14905_18115 [Bacillus sp. B14905]|nr:hypothetical protein BB14905_18115 [Bacillus sp. B14905]